MSRSCGFCKTVGHRINNCTHYRANELVYTAEFKCNIALQYVETAESARLFDTIEEWFNEKSVAELRLLISKKKWPINGNKKILVTRAILVYYFNQPIMFSSENNRNRFIAIRNYWYNIADGMSEIIAMRQYLLDLDQNNKTKEEKIKIITMVEFDFELSECPVCFEIEEKIAITNCGHQFCRGCIDKHTEGFVKPCPCCRTKIIDISVN